MTPRERRTFLALATRVHLSELVGCASTAGAGCRDQLRGDSGDVGTCAVGYRFSGLNHHSVKASRPKETAVIHAQEPGSSSKRASCSLRNFSLARLRTETIG